jgi:catechol 2,3-dioxygenase-like lactoylglutathione lyase family enzyme
MTTRRRFLISIPALAAAFPAALRSLAQSGQGTIPLHNYNHVTLTVSDVKQSLEFYQGLFGLAIQNRQTPVSATLQVGPGPMHLGLSPQRGDAKVGINHFCVTTAAFDVDRMVAILAEHGVAKPDPASEAGGPMRAFVSTRGPDRGGSPEGTPEFYFYDPDGIRVQIQHAEYCGGSGYFGNVCQRTPQPSPTPGLLKLQDYNHITLGVLDQQRARAFYRAVFGMPTLGRQGNSESLQIGSGNQFLATGTTTANGGTPGKANIAHVCFTVQGFDLDKIRKTLTEFGLKAVDRVSGAAPPRSHYVSLRMPDRGGAPGGTPELYVTDPDGIVLQLQDTSYCGGAGYLGNVCA